MRKQTEKFSLPVKGFPIHTLCLYQYLQGEVISCGIPYFQTADGSQWLGEASKQSIAEAKLLLSDADALPDDEMREMVIQFLRETGYEKK